MYEKAKKTARMGLQLTGAVQHMREPHQYKLFLLVLMR